MSEQQKLTDEEFSTVTELRNNIAVNMSTIGQLKVTYELMKEDLSTIESQIAEKLLAHKELMGQEKKLVSALLEKYGIGSLDIETGVFTPEK